MPPDPPSLTCLCMYKYTSEIHITPILKILVTGLQCIGQLSFHYQCMPLEEVPNAGLQQCIFSFAWVAVILLPAGLLLDQLGLALLYDIY